MKNPKRPVTPQTLCQQANRVGGQLLSIERMVRESRSPEEILNLLLACEATLQSLIYQQFSVIIYQYFHHLIQQLAGSGNLTPDLQNFIDKIRQKQSPYLLKELPKVFYDLKQFRHPLYS